jgi:hypothetical protein
MISDAYRRGHDLIRQQNEDERRRAFIHRLDATDLEFTESETEFIGGYIESPRPLSIADKNYIDALARKYTHRL